MRTFAKLHAIATPVFSTLLVNGLIGDYILAAIAICCGCHSGAASLSHVVKAIYWG